MVPRSRHSDAESRTIESALRFIGTRDHDIPVDLLEYAIDRPASEAGQALAPLTAATAALSGWTTAERALAVWHLIMEGVRDRDVGPTPHSRRRRALQAAFRMHDDDIAAPWGGSLSERFRQMRSLHAVFGEPTSTQPMEMAWKRGVRALAVYVDRRLSELASPADWNALRTASDGVLSDNADRWWARSEGSGGHEIVFRKPSKGAQPVFVNLFVTTVFMRRRAVYRRITERLITAREDDVKFYTARGFAGKTPRLTYVPVRALWGCRAESVERPGRPAVTQLWFPQSLRKGEQAHFASEIVDENITEERHWIDVDVDHHGIAPGRLAYGGLLPVSGLTIRVRFDPDFLPEALWWYAELNESERYDQPPAGNPRLLKLDDNDVQYTFVDQPCQPRESYGLAFSWPEAM